jgi:hypothetical protein
MTRPWLGMIAALAMAGFAHGVSFAQSDTGAGPGPGDGGASQDGGGAPGGDGGHHGGGHGMLREACQADLARLCANVEAGGGRVFQCIREHHDELSDGCKAALQSMHGGGHGWRHDAPPGGGGGDAAPTSPPPDAPGGATSPASPQG